jgi:hypothetical protein
MQLFSPLTLLSLFSLIFEETAVCLLLSYAVGFLFLPFLSKGSFTDVPTSIFVSIFFLQSFSITGNGGTAFTQFQQRGYSR